MLTDRIKNVKYWAQERKDDLFIAGIIFFVGMTSFGLGRLSAIWPKKEPVTVRTNQESEITNYGDDKINKIETPSRNSAFGSRTSSQGKFDIQNSPGKYVASKSGTSYHFPWCAGALKIKEENKIWFQTKEEAGRAGYKPAGNCEGL